MMATITWTSGASSDWDVVANWSTAAPGSSDTVAISLPGTYDITIGATQAVSIDSLYLTEAELTVIGALTLDDAAATSIIGPSATLQEAGTHNGTWALYDDGKLLNQGTITASGAGSFMTNWAQTLYNTGVVIAAAGAQILLDSQNFQNIANGTLTGGTYVAAGSGSGYGSVIDLESTAAVSTTLVADDADITLSGSGSELYGFHYNPANSSDTYVPLENTLGTIGTGGVLNVLAGRGYQGTLALTVDGLLALGGGSLSVPGLLVASGGTLAGFGTVVPAIGGSGVVEAQGGTLDLAGGIVGTGALRVDAGAAVVDCGRLGGSLVNQGTVIVSSASLDVTGSISGSGGFLLIPGSLGAVTTLELDAPVSSGITFGGDYATLSLDLPNSFSGTIVGFGAGDTIDLAGMVANGASLVGTTLDLTQNGTVVDALKLANPGAGLTYTATPNGAGGIVLSATGQGITFNFTYDASVASAPAGFEQALTIAADDLAALIRDPITLTIEVGWGEIGNTTTLTNGDNEGGADGGIYLPYSQFKADFLANETDQADVVAGENLPAADPTGGVGIYVSYAQEKAWGLLPQNSSETDGQVGFASTTLWNYGTSFTAGQSNESYFIGVAEHELTHAMGRAPGNYLDLFRYTGPGTLQTSETAAAYFSINGGTTDLDTFDPTNSDPSDWQGNAGPDPFNLYYVPDVLNTITPVDDELLSVLGFDVSCFASGTCLLTERGEVRVDDLRAGENLVARFGGTASRIIWIGHQTVDCRHHAHPGHVWPIRIRPGAFAPDTPRRDLFLSPEHAVLVDGVLIPIKYLINGTTIIQEQRDEVTYWHVELERHDVILAEGVACETYLDTGNRQTFAQGASSTARAPKGGIWVAAIWEAAGCARLLTNAAPQAAATSDLAVLLQPDFYLAANPDVAASGMDAATHYRGWGRAEGRLPCPELDLIRGLGLIDPGILHFAMPDVVLAGLDPVAHFCTKGWQEGRRPNAYFDTGEYISAYDVPRGMNPLLHYILTGESAGLLPGEHFHPAWYRRRHGLGICCSPLAHYLLHRHGQLVSPLPSFDVTAYGVAHAATLRAGRDPFLHCLAVGHGAAAALQTAA
jgi:hypothetical protein